MKETEIETVVELETDRVEIKSMIIEEQHSEVEIIEVKSSDSERIESEKVNESRVYRFIINCKIIIMEEAPVLVSP